MIIFTYCIYFTSHNIHITFKYSFTKSQEYVKMLSYILVRIPNITTISYFFSSSQ